LSSLIESTEAAATAAVGTTISRTLAASKSETSNKKEMYTDDQDEDVEEEEEFHEVEEEKHRTSQESVGDSANSPKFKPITNNKLEQTEKVNEESMVSAPAENSSTIETSQTIPDLQVDDCLAKRDRVTGVEDVQVEHLASSTICSKEPSGSIEETRDEVPSLALGSSDEVKPCQTDLERLSPVPSTESKDPPSTDWANVMRNSNSDETKHLDSTQPESSNELTDIIKQTEELKLNESSSKSTQSLNEVEPSDDKVEPTQTVSEVEPASDAKPSQDDTPEIVEDQRKSDDAEKKELDLDEIEENPQYIPKKGDFYEHDDRSQAFDDEASTNKNDHDSQIKDTKANRKSSYQEKQRDSRRSYRRPRIDTERWNHDLYRDEKHKPKTGNLYSSDLRQQERGVRTQHEARIARSSNVADRSQGSQESRSRQSRDGRSTRQNQSINRSRDRKARRNIKGNRNDVIQQTQRARDSTNNRENRSKNESRDSKEPGEDKHSVSQPSIISQPNISMSKKDFDSRDLRETKNTRNDSRSRRRTSRDRPKITVDDKLPQPNTVMPPITTWSNEDMVKAEAFSKDLPPKQQTNQAASLNSNRNRPYEFWSQGQPSKNDLSDRSLRANEDQRNHGSRMKYQDRGEDVYRLNQLPSRNQFNDRPIQTSNDWHRGGNFNPQGKSSDYIVKTQTFENSRLSQANRSNNRDLRDVINDRRSAGQQYFQHKIAQNVDSQTRGQGKPMQYHYGQHQMAHQSNMMPHHQAPPHLIGQHHMQHQPPQIQTHQTSLPSQHQQMRSNQPQQNKQTGPQLAQQPSSSQAQTLPISQPSLHAARQHLDPQANLSRNGPSINTMTENQDSTNMGDMSGSDSLSSRPIIKTDTYTNTSAVVHASHQPGPHIPQPTQNHRAMVPSMAQQQSPNPSGSHIVPHLETNNVPTQYYAPSGTRAAMASAYHSYIPSAHTVMDSGARYHIASQQMPDHGYMSSSGQTGDVAGPVMHQQGMYADTTSGGTVASSAYMPQAGPTMSPASNIPVTGSGGPQPLPPVSYIQHSQYHPSPYSNPYTQHQPNQAPPPHSGQAYPYWYSYTS